MTPSPPRPRGLPALLALTLLAASPATAQRPFATQDPRILEPGRFALELGVDWLPGTTFGASGLAGDLLRAPRAGLRVPLGSAAEFQVETGLNLLLIEKRHDGPLAGELTVEDDTTADMDDPVVATKVRLWKEGDRLPGVGFRAATRLPVAGNESGLGLDTIDFFATLLAGKSIGPTRLAANAGIGILADPIHGTSQNDVLVLGASVAHRLHPALEIVGETWGRADPSGRVREGQEDTGQIRAGIRYGVGAQVVDAALVLGLADVDPGAGLVVGVTRTVTLGDPR